MKLLSGLDLAGFIKERQARQVRGLRQAEGVVPRLAIVQTLDNPVSDKYLALKKSYGTDILVEVDIHKVPQEQALEVIDRLNKDAAVHGVILQLPLADPKQTDQCVNAVAPQKDVDGLGQHATLDPATPLAILWLLAGYNVTLPGKHIVLVGHGRLVGAPLARMLRQAGHNVEVVDGPVDHLELITNKADVLITATGQPKLITSAMVKPGAVVVDAGVATDAGKLVGDVADDVRERDDLAITPVRGGVGPLTVCALFDNVIRAARASLKT